MARSDLQYAAAQLSASPPSKGGPHDDRRRRPVLVVDNFDSFVYNLVQYLGQLGVRCIVRRNDAVDVDELADLDVAGVLLSPGPGTPADAGVTVPMVRAAAEQGVPVLGVCLGHQAIARGLRRRRRAGAGAAARQDQRGRARRARACWPGCRRRSPRPATTRWPSTRPPCPPSSRSPAHTASGVVMALRHRELPIEGVQFHPESVLTEGGHQLLANWLAACGLAPDPAVVDAAAAAGGCVRRPPAGPRPTGRGPFVVRGDQPTISSGRPGPPRSPPAGRCRPRCRGCRRRRRPGW